MLSDRGGGDFLVSLAGHRVIVQSDIALREGQSFRAVLRGDPSGKILLVPETPDFKAGMLNAADFSLASLFSSEQAAQDGILLKLVQFFQQSGLKIDTSVMERARRVAAKFPGKEGKAAEIAALLLEKGVEPTESAVSGLLSLLDFSDGHGGGEENSPGKDEADGGQDFLSGLYVMRPVKGPGPLTLINQISSGRRHWVILPFQWQNGEKEADGIIRLLLDTERKSVEKIEINCTFPLKKYFFVVYFDSSRLREIRFCTSPPLTPSQAEAAEGRLGKMFSSGTGGDVSVSATYTPSAMTDGLCSSDERPVTYENKA